MKTVKDRTKEMVLEEKTENLIAIGAAVASNCIPCFEHIYEKAITSGISSAEIQRATDVAEQVKAGAQKAISNSVEELVGHKNTKGLACSGVANRSCCI